MGTVVMSAGTFQWYQEKKSEEIMQSFANYVPQDVSVMRDGNLIKMKAVNLVPGDIVMLSAGEKLPADVRIISCTGDMKVDNSSLTGEAEPQQRGINCTCSNAMETENLAFLGTLVLQGKGEGMVYATGDNTLLGKIAALANGSSKTQSTFAEEVEHFVGLVSFFLFLFNFFFELC